VACLSSSLSRLQHPDLILEVLWNKENDVLLHGSSKDILNEVNHNLADETSVVCNFMFNLTLLPDGGAVEMEVVVSMHTGARGQ
jgi:hypothetical protein